MGKTKAIDLDLFKEFTRSIIDSLAYHKQHSSIRLTLLIRRGSLSNKIINRSIIDLLLVFLDH